MIKPLLGFVLVEPEKAKEYTTSGIYLPERSQERPARGKIIAIGGVPLEWLKVENQFPESVIFDFHVNDIVYFKRWAGTEVKEDGKEYIFVKFEDLLGVVE